MKNSIPKIAEAQELLKVLVKDILEGHITPKEVETATGMVIRHMGDVQFEMSLLQGSTAEDVIASRDWDEAKVPDIKPARGVALMKSSAVDNWLRENTKTPQLTPDQYYFIEGEEDTFYLRDDIAKCIHSQYLRMMEVHVDTLMRAFNELTEV